MNCVTIWNVYIVKHICTHRRLFVLRSKIGYLEYIDTLSQLSYTTDYSHKRVLKVEQIAPSYIRILVLSLDLGHLRFKKIVLFALQHCFGVLVCEIHTRN